MRVNKEKRLTIEDLNRGKRIASARIEKGFSQAMLAEMVGCSNKYVSQMENGTMPSYKMICKLCKALDKSIEYFMADTPQVENEYLIQNEIAYKLSRCNKYSLNLVNKILDDVLECQENLRMFAKDIINQESNHSMSE